MVVRYNGELWKRFRMGAAFLNGEAKMTYSFPATPNSMEELNTAITAIG